MADLDIDLRRMVQTVEKRWKADEPRRERWKRYRDVYEGVYWKADTEASLSKVDCGKLFSTVSQLAPLMTDSRPVWSVVARDPIFQPVIEQWSKALEYLWDVLDMSWKINDAYQDALLQEQGVFQVDYDSDAGEVSVEVVDPNHLVFAEGDYSDISECPWVAKRRAVTLGDVRRTYPDVADQIVADDADGRTHDDSFTATTRWVTTYELWMRDPSVEEDMQESVLSVLAPRARKRRRKMRYPNGRVMVFTKTGTEAAPVLLDDYASPFSHGQPPFVIVYDYRLSHSIWGVGEGRHLMPLIDELNELLQSISSKIRNACRTNYMLDAALIDVDQFKADHHRGFQVFTKKGRDDVDPRFTGVETIPQGPPIQAEFQFVAYLSELIEDLTSVTAILKGQAGKRERQTAQEWSGLFESGHTRTRLRVRNMERSIEKVLSLILSVAMDKYSTPRHFSQRDDTGVTFGVISNRREDAQALVAQDVEAQLALQRQGGVERPVVHGQSDPELAKAVAQQQLEAALPVGEDQVRMRFDLVVQPQSTLPTDVQSRANLVLRLAQMGIVDAEEALKRLEWPGWEEIVARMRRNAEAAQGAATNMAGVQDAGTYGSETTIEPPALVAAE